MNLISDYYILFQTQPEWNRSLGRPSCKWKDNIKMNLKVGYVRWVPVTTEWRVLGLRMEVTPSRCGG